MKRARLFGLGCAAVALGLGGCAAMASVVVGTHEWFERKEPGLTRAARTDLECRKDPIAFISLAHED